MQADADPRSEQEARRPRVGVIGLGTIGSGVIISLDRSGVMAMGYDIDPNRATALPCRPARSAAEVAAASDVVVIAVVNAEQANDVLFGPEGVAAGADAGLIVALLSTVSLDALMELNLAAARSGLRLLDTPATAGQHVATNGLVVMVGGDAATAKEAEPALAAFAKAVIYCGPLGAGLAAKLVRQVIVFGSWKVMYDAARFAEAVGVEYRLVKEINRQADASGDTVLGLMSLRGDSLAELPAAHQETLKRYFDLMVKDLTAVRQLGDAHGFRLPMMDELINDPGPAMYGITKGVERDD